MTSTASPFPHDAFVHRHVGTDPDAQRRMLEAVGVEDLDALLEAAVPGTILLDPRTDDALGDGASEAEVLSELRGLARANTVRTPLLGEGYYGTVTPAAIQRNVLENPAWYTAYTPYQPEISQGRLEALLNYQTVVADLTGLPIANSSMLDEATSAAEAMLLARRATRAKVARFVIDEDMFTATEAVVRGRAEAVGIELVSADLKDPASAAAALEDGAFGVLAQYPAASGLVWDPQPLAEAVHAAGGKMILASDLLALTLLTPPGELGADVAVGSSQRFGVPLGFGGPHAGFMSVAKGLERQLPGRLVGVSQDAEGNPALRLALQTREQHIRREKATSNICTAQVLLAVMASMYAVHHGPDGLRRIARQVAARTADLASALTRSGFPLAHDAFFDTLTVAVPGRAEEIAAALAETGYLIRIVDADTLRLSLDETTDAGDLEALVGVMDGFAPAESSVPGGIAADGAVSDAATDGSGPSEGADEDGLPEIGAGWPAELHRTSAYLADPVFSSFHSETALMRYLRRLSDQDYALDRGMIPLGSCTMKLNAAVEMSAITWPEFAAVHPFAPREDVEGYLELIDSLERFLADITGYDTVSLQPNAGSQGEYAGLLAIRAYHLSRGDSERTVCLVPASAHGTNAASAVLAGLRVVVVASDAEGNVEVDDLQQKIKDHGDELAAIMITYPSTHGVYEQQVRTVCELVHDAGGQVYVDGANMNAMVEVARPGEFGGDVSHLNLHKTFCIPHGGGGPGVGPVAAKAHLAPFLPGHPLMQDPEHYVAGHPATVHGGAPVSQAPYGSPSILPIPWAYIRLMGAAGLRHATASAVLAANYIAARLKDVFDILYRGENGLVAHECILDLRPFTARTGITVDDVAKRLIDHGFHAPTMSFPVAGTLMVEPTESEDLSELDRFVDAMLMIAEEAEQVASGAWPKDDNPLVNAPHTAQAIAREDWSHPYSREIAVYPGVHASRESIARGRRHDSVQMRIAAKYWPPVRRVDQAFGDRNLVCTCQSPEAYAES
ncbi:aminomethyl-transferring glycine dehydrogenase [Brachybacterium subflavum]|uniref:aminomethyl-transferring glycine dehydrogenase n=1 Tax=Brachybacterium subflavum TaxID=2585206 RepID=UPI001D0D4B6A|nr:aminomethyl-transferring glycine dehydrogenase [Brachybacterium subflavum]